MNQTMPTPCAENEYRKLGDLPDAASQSKVEIWTRPGDDGAPVLELVEYSWGSGLGWYVQKRLRLDSGQVDALKTVLGINETAAPRPQRLMPAVVRNDSDNVIQLVFPG
jgi:hypothetical protein